MLLPKDKGGLVLPNFKLYYWAAQLTAIVAWIENDQETGWTQIEQSTAKGISISTLPFIDTKSLNKIKIENEWIKHTLKIWTIIKKTLEGPSTLSRAMPIVGNIEFPPSIWDSGFRRWADRGLKTINQLFDKTELKSFSQLQEQYLLPSKDLYKYLQMRHYITNHKDLQSVRRNPNVMEDYFISITEKCFPTKKHISHIYRRLIIADKTQNTLNIKEKWELELNVIIEDSTWEDLCSTCHKGINSPLWKEFDWKLKMRYFYTPLVISSFGTDPLASLCWRNCGKIGDHTHIFWDCPLIRGFWKNIKTEINKIIEVEVPLEPLIFLLGSIPKDLGDTDRRYILRILLIIARKMITVNWKTVNTSSITQWRQRLKQVHTMEKMTAKLQMKTDTFTRRWTLVTLYLDTME